MTEQDWSQHALALLELGRLDEAERMAVRVLQYDLHSHPALLTIALVYQRRCDVDRLQKASRLLIAAHPDRHEGYMLLSGALMYTSEWDAAIEAAQRAVSLAPGDPFALQTLASALGAAPGRTADAIRAAEEAARLAPDTSWPWVALSGVYTMAQRGSEAIAAANRALAIDPMSVLGRVHLGVAYLHNGDHAEALKELRAALSQESSLLVFAIVEASLLDIAVPMFTRSLYEQVRVALGHPDLTDCNARVTDPQLVRLRCIYAQGEATYGDQVRAGHIVASVLRDVPGEPVARRLSASLTERSGELTTAVRLAEDLLRDGIGDSGTHHVRTHSLQRLDRYAEALDALSEAVQAYPQVAEFPLRRAEVLVSLGRTDEARDWLGRAISIDPDNRCVQQLADRLTRPTMT